MAQPLPTNPYAPGSLYSVAYATCVQMETHAITINPAPNHGPSIPVRNLLMPVDLIRCQLTEW
jgi:hypothetical protein